LFFFDVSVVTKLIIIIFLFNIQYVLV